MLLSMTYGTTPPSHSLVLRRSALEYSPLVAADFTGGRRMSLSIMATFSDAGAIRRHKCVNIFCYRLLLLKLLCNIFIAKVVVKRVNKPPFSMHRAIYSCLSRARAFIGCVIYMPKCAQYRTQSIPAGKHPWKLIFCNAIWRCFRYTLHAQYSLFRNLFETYSSRLAQKGPFMSNFFI